MSWYSAALLMPVYVHQWLHWPFSYSNFYRTIILDFRDDPYHLTKWEVTVAGIWGRSIRHLQNPCERVGDSCLVSVQMTETLSYVCSTQINWLIIFLICSSLCPSHPSWLCADWPSCVAAGQVLWPAGWRVRGSLGQPIFSAEHSDSRNCQLYTAREQRAGAEEFRHGLYPDGCHN